MATTTLTRTPTFVDTLNELTDPYQRQSLDQVKEAFANHELTVLRDDGTYRHLRYSAPGTGMYRFDIHTAPGLLTINGDIGTFVFSRVRDMLSFFANEKYTNVSYWQEKLLAPAPRDVQEYDQDAASRAVSAYVDDITVDWPDEVVDALREELDNAMFGAWDSEHELVSALLGFDWTYDQDASFTFDISEAYDLSIRSYKIQYLFACHALRAASLHYIATGWDVDFTG